MIQDITGSELNVGDVVVAAVNGDLRIIRVEEVVESHSYSRSRSQFLVKAKTIQTNYSFYPVPGPLKKTESRVYRYFSGPFYKVIR